MRKLLKSESGVILPMALIMLLAGSILIVPLLNSVSTGLLISQRTGLADSGNYSGDAGIEDAIWDLTFDDLADDIPNEDDSTTYDVDDTINGDTVSVTVTNLGTLLAADNLESGNWTGGSGWLNSWSSSGKGVVAATRDQSATFFGGASNARIWSFVGRFGMYSTSPLTPVTSSIRLACLQSV